MIEWHFKAQLKVRDKETRNFGNRCLNQKCATVLTIFKKPSQRYPVLWSQWNKKHLRVNAMFSKCDSTPSFTWLTYTASKIALTIKASFEYTNGHDETISYL